MVEASLTFPAELNSVSAARRFLRTTLSGWQNENYDFAAPLVLTELVTNATLHARTPYTVMLRLEPTHLVMEVIDSSPQLPQPRNYALDATTGRGIKLVNSFSATWGARPTRNGKVVWAHIRPDNLDMVSFTDPEDEHVRPAKDAVTAERSPSPTGRRQTTGGEARVANRSPSAA